MLALVSRRSVRLACLVALVTVIHLGLLGPSWQPQGLARAHVETELARMTLVTPKRLATTLNPPADAALAPETALAQPGLKAPIASSSSSSARVAQGPAQPSERQPAPVDLPPAPAIEPAVEASLIVDAAPVSRSDSLAESSLAPAAASATDPAVEGAPLLPMATAVPAESAQWTYAVVRGAATGEAKLNWSVSEAGYELALRAAAGGRPVLDWVSRGTLSAQGLQPLRMVERQREREVHAVNFQRDKSVISFAGPSRTDALLPGAQDRLSWIVQLMAAARAQGGLQPGTLLRFQVAGARGDVDEWRFTVQPLDEQLINGRRLGLIHLLREPQRPHDLRVQLWLAPQFDLLPVGIAWGVEPGGERLQMWMTSLPSSL